MFLDFTARFDKPLARKMITRFHQSRLLVAATLVLCVTSADAQAPTPAAPSGKNLTVVTRKVTPFVMEKNGHLTGYSIELWERVVREARLPFDPDKDYKVVDTVTQMLDELRAGRADAGVAAISITSEREQTVDFSYPFKESGLQILTREQPGSSFGKIVSGLFKGDILWLLGGLLFVLLLNSHIIWFLERKKNPESFPEGYLAGLWEAIWWSVCTIITGGCENKAPLGVAGRLTAIVWMLAGAGLFTYITATITSAMTVDTLNSDVRSIAELKTKRWPVGTVAGSTAQGFLERQGLTVQTYPDADAACAALGDGKVKAVVYDAPMLLYYAKNNPDQQLGVVGELFEKQSYGIGVPQGSPYRKEITRAILALRERGFLDELENRYFGTGTGDRAIVAAR